MPFEYTRAFALNNLLNRWKNNSKFALLREMRIVVAFMLGKITLKIIKIYASK